jgi:DNA primase
VYDWIVQQSPLLESGRNYLLGRRIGDATIRAFQVGQIGDATELMIEAQKYFGIERLHKCGMLVGRTHARLVFPSGYLVFPFLDGGACRYLQARALGSPPPKVRRWIVLSGLRPPIYNVDVLRRAGNVFLCEGVTDVLSAYELNRPAFALLGAGAQMPPDCIELLRNRTVCILSDNDRAGRSMGQRLLEQLSRLGIDVVVQKWPAGIKDVSDHLILSRK